MRSWIESFENQLKKKGGALALLLFTGVLGILGTFTPCQAEPVDARRIESILQTRKNAVRRCYQVRVIKTRGKLLGGKLLTAFTVNPKGRATRIRIESNTLHDPKTESCVLKVIGRLRYPKLENGRSYEVQFPFRFDTKVIAHRTPVHTS